MNQKGISVNQNETQENNSKKRGNAASVLARSVGIIFIVAVILVLIPIYVPRILGQQAFTVISGSMEPEIPIGSLVIVKDTDPAGILTGDIIAFYRSDTVVTHRVVENQTEEGQFITKGDANEQPDVNPVPYSDLIGVMVRQFKGLGSFLAFFSTIGGKIALIVMVILGILLQLAAAKLRQS